MYSTFYTPATFAEIYQVPIVTVWRWIREGKIEGVIRIGKHYRISHESRMKFEKAHLVKGK